MARTDDTESGAGRGRFQGPRPGTAGAVFLTLLAFLPGCAGDLTRPDPGPEEAQVLITGGDGQSGTVHTALPVLLEITVVGPNGQPRRGVAVSWELAVNGTIEPLSTATNDQGRATARFILGGATGPASAMAVVPGTALPAVQFSFVVRAVDELPPYGVLIPLLFQTYDGAGETVHPDWAATPSWDRTDHLALTPYPGGNAGYENPSLFGGTLLDWAVPPGVRNPVALPSGGHLSDPDLVYLPEADELWLYYRQADGRNRVFLTVSADRGAHWTAPVEVVSTPNHEILSPAVVRRSPGDWWMWSVNGRAAGCSAGDARLELRRSMDGVTWSAPQGLDLAHDGLYPWHVDVQWIPTRDEYWAVYNAKLPGSCTTPALFLARSADGIDWVPHRAAVVVKGATPALQDIVYRATFRYQPVTDDLLLWISGARYAAGRWIWSTLFHRRAAAALLDLGATPFDPLSVPPPPEELTDWP